MAGRPTIYTEDLANAVADLIFDGKSPEEIGAMDGMPSRRTIFYWKAENPEFAKMYEAALPGRAEILAEEALKIADDETRDTIEDPKKGPVACGHKVQRDKLRVETRFRMAARFDPARWSDKSQLALTGANGGAVEMNDTALETKVASLMAIAQARKDAAEGAKAAAAEDEEQHGG